MKHIKKTIQLFLATIITLPKGVDADGGDGGGGGGADISVQSTSVSISVDGETWSGQMDAHGNFSCDNGVSISGVGESSVSTPFLLTYNGEKFIFENDFLFGKPNTAFANQAIGLREYTRGIGGDTYLLQNEIKPDKDGYLKFEIRELEPEESYIDRFELNAIDLKVDEHFVVNGDLERSYIFNTNEAKVVNKQTIHHFHKKSSLINEVKSAYNTLVPQSGESITLMTEDQLIIQIPKDQLSEDQDTYILVDSHYRDWSLGSTVPFSALERFQISSLALGRGMAVTMTGVFLLASGVFMGNAMTHSGFLEKLVKVPYTYADVPYSQGNYQGAYSGDGSGGWSGGRSLVISAGDTTTQTYLQTLFPRYVQASQEVVLIPKEIIKNLNDTLLTIKIKATKKHKVRAAFIFQGTATAPRLQPLSITTAKHQREIKDYAASLSSKNHSFLHTIPGDRVEVLIKDHPRVLGTQRRYVLKTNGFYTRMSAATVKLVGPKWLGRLLPEDRELLKNLKLS